MLCEKDHFTLSYGEETVLLKFETRIMNGKLPSVITYAHDMLRSLVLCSIAYAIVCNNGRIKYITSEVLASKRDWMVKEQHIVNVSSAYIMRTTII